MSFDRILGQDGAKTVLRAWMGSGRLPHTMLISGPPGTGKRLLALELAKAINCERAEEGEACDNCSSCRKSDKLTHPDLHVLLPLATGREKSGSPDGDVQRAAALDYLASGESSPSTGVNISIERIRFLQKEMNYAPTESARRIGVILEVDCMHRAGANSLLKILEEPPDRAVFILASTHPERILPTIASRCQQLSLRRLGSTELRSGLKERGLSPDRIELAVGMGEGNLQRALQVASGEYDETQRNVEGFIGGAITQDGGVYWALVDQLGAKAERPQLERFLEGCLICFRDLLILQWGDRSAVVQKDRLDFLEKASPRFSLDQLEFATKEVDRALDNLRRNVNANILLADLWRHLWECGRRTGAIE